MTDKPYFDILEKAVLLSLTGRGNEALDCCNEAEMLFSGQFETVCILGLVAFQMGEYGRGIDLIESAHNTAPDVRDIADLLAVLLAKVGRVTDSLYYAKLATALEPHEELHRILPEMLRDYKLGLEKVSSPKFYLSAMMDFENEDYDACIRLCEKELQLNKDSWLAYQLLGRAHMVTGNPHKAVSALRVAVARLPENIAENMSFLAKALLLSGQREQALAMYQEASIANPENLNVLSELKSALKYKGSHSREETNATKGIDAMIESRCEEVEMFDFEPLAGRKIKLGFISNQFKDGETNHFLMGLISSINREQFEIYGYQKNLFKDLTTTRFEQQFDQWSEFQELDNETAAYVISSDELDILFDCDGHGFEHSIDIMAQHPAHVTATWRLDSEKSEINGCGFEFVSNYLLDALPYMKDEKTIALNDAGICVDLGAITIEAGRVMDAPCKNNKFVTFGVFCDLDKITPQAASLWSRILHANNSCRLMFGGRGAISQEARNTLIELFSNYGIADRIAFHLEWEEGSPIFTFLSHIDILLDTTPVSGMLETVNALLKGVPVLALGKGERPASFVSARILKAAGCEEWIANTEQEYWMKAIEMASNLSLISKTREDLRERVSSSPLCDGDVFARSFEKACIEALENKKLI